MEPMSGEIWPTVLSRAVKDRACSDVTLVFLLI